MDPIPTILLLSGNILIPVLLVYGGNRLVRRALRIELEEQDRRNRE